MPHLLLSTEGRQLQAVSHTKAYGPYKQQTADSHEAQVTEHSHLSSEKDLHKEEPVLSSSMRQSRKPSHLPSPNRITLREHVARIGGGVEMRIA
jgi:hypothetical protein